MSPADRARVPPWLALAPWAGPESPSEPAFRALFDRYYARVRRFFCNRGLPLEEAEDLTQETFTRVLRSGGTFATEDHFRGWLFCIAANLFRNLLRDRHARGQAAREHSLDGLMEEERPGRLGLAAREATTVRPEQLAGALARERSTLLEQEVAALPDRMRRCVWLRGYQGLKYEEIASVMRIKVDSVKAHLYQARERLRPTLAPFFDDVDL